MPERKRQRSLSVQRAGKASRNVRTGGSIRAIAALLSLVCTALPGGVAARPFIPSFWNPDAVPQKPDLGGLGAIRFLTSDDYPPFGIAQANGVAAGFDVDLARALCQELQVTCTIQARAWAGILPALTANQGDAAIASLAIPKEARPGLAFTRPYLKTPARFIVHLPSPMAAVDSGTLAGKHVGVVAGTAHEAYLRSFFPGAIATVFATVEEARAALRAGAIHVVFGDAISWSVWMNGTDAQSCCAFAGGPYTEPKFFGLGAGIAVRKDDVRLRQALDYALARVAAKCTYGDIYLRYFPLGLY